MVKTKTTDYVKKQVRVALYVRVSTQEQAKEGYSIKEQIDRLQKFAEAHEWFVVKIYTDAGHSGANMERPALQDMIEDIMAGKIDKVAVYKLDRLSRSQKDTLELIEDIFLKNSCDFESMTEKFDTATSFGRAMVGILAVFAQLEREQIKERMSMGIDARIKEGKWRGGSHVPFGYDYESALDKLVVNEYEAMIVKHLFEAFAEGQSMYSIAEELDEKGQSIGGRRTDRRSMRYILRNKTYCGYMKHHDEYVKGLHDAIIDEGLYDKVQIILDENKRRFEESGYKTGSAAVSTHLSGLLYCARCGGKYSKTQTGNAQYGYNIKYGCYSRHKRVKCMIKDPNCKNNYYKVEELDQYIFNEVKKLAIDPEYINQIKKESQKSDEVKQIHAIEARIKSINAQLSRFMDLYGLGTYDLDELDEKTKPLTAQRSKLKKELKKLQENSKRITEEQVMHLVSSFDEVLEKGDLHDRRSILEQLIDRIDIDGEEITIHWNFI